MPFVEAATSIACPVEKAFDFLIHTANLLRLFPEELRVSVVDAPAQLALGSRLDLQILGFGPPQNVTYEITEFSRPHRFTETQVKGLLPRYVHEHVLVAQSADIVLISDRIEFEPPGGLMGFMVTADRLRTSLGQGLAHRHSVLKRSLEKS